MRPSLLTILALVFVASESAAQQPVPVGLEFQANTYTTGEQSRPAVIPDGSGGFAIAWTSDGSSGTDSSVSSIQGQRYSGVGAPMGEQFQVNEYTPYIQREPAMGSVGGGFIVTWESDGSAGTDSSGFSIQGQRYLSDGSLAGGEFQVNSYTTGWQNHSAVSPDGAGGFVVTWDSEGSNGSDIGPVSIQGQLYAADGSPVGGQFQVNSYTPGIQGEPAVGADGAGGFVVSWHSDGSSGTDSNGYSIQGQRYSSDGSPVGVEFQVNSYTTGGQFRPAVGSSGPGSFLVVWESDGSVGPDSSVFSIQGQLYASDGSPIGGQFQVNTYTTGSQFRPAVSQDGSGGLVVIWESEGSGGTDSSGFSIQGRRFASDGSPVGVEFQVNTYTPDGQLRPAVGTDGAGGFLVVWDSEGSSGSDSSDQSIQVQLFDVPIFADGFESGDTSAWSTTVP